MKKIYLIKNTFLNKNNILRIFKKKLLKVIFEKRNESEFKCFKKMIIIFYMYVCIRILI